MMQTVCQIVPDIDAFAPGVFGYFDCQARTLGAAGYQALAAPGGTGSVLLGVMLTLFVAFIGYRMLFGETPSARDGVLAFVKIGVVLALASDWPAYQTLIYDVALTAPAQLAAEIGTPAGLPGLDGDLAARLDGVDQAFKALAIDGVGSPPVGADGQLVTTGAAPPLFLGFDTFALGASRAIFLASAVAAFALVRIAAGLLLALGPLFLAFLLFDGTRGLFEGWARGLIGAALGAMATAIVLAIELALFEPWLAALVARRDAALDIIGAPAQLLAMTSVFAVILTAMLLLVMRVAAGLRLPYWRGATESHVRTAFDRERLASTSTTTMHVPIESRSRAAAIADAVAATERRESLVYAGGTGSVGRPSFATVAMPASTGQAGVGSRYEGSDMRRRATTRVSASAGRRDRI